PLVAQFPDRPFYRAELARSHYALGLALWTAARWADAEAAYRESLAAAAPLDRTADRHRATVHNDWAWMLATCPDANVLDPRRAVELAEKAVELDPRPSYWNTLGAARYRADDFAGALTALDKAMAPRKGGDSFDWFFVAMGHWRLGHADEARTWYA